MAISYPSESDQERTRRTYEGTQGRGNVIPMEPMPRDEPGWKAHTTHTMVTVSGDHNNHMHDGDDGATVHEQEHNWTAV